MHVLRTLKLAVRLFIPHFLPNRITLAALGRKKRRRRNISATTYYGYAVGGILVPARKLLKSVSAWRGACMGTSCPAPRIVTNVRPSYTIVHPPTCTFHPPKYTSILFDACNQGAAVFGILCT